jgi:hypothetical protein
MDSSGEDLDTNELEHFDKNCEYWTHNAFFLELRTYIT